MYRFLSGAPARICASVLAISPTLAGDPAPQPPDQPSLERIKELVGPWVVVDGLGTPTDLRGDYRVIAAGSAVMETLFGGTPQETNTIYHVERARVTVTQLSARGVPVRLVPRDSENAGVYRFVAEDARAGELSALELSLTGEDRLRIEWTFADEEGAESVSRCIDLSREPRVEHLAAEASRLDADLQSLQQELDRRLKREVEVKEKGRPTRVVFEMRTLPTSPGWSVSGDPFHVFLLEDTTRFASTFSTKGDAGMTVAHYGFRAGPGCRLRFSVIGGHGYIAVVEEERAPPRNIKSIPEFSERLLAGDYGITVEHIVGKNWNQPRSVEWDLSGHAGKAMRLYVVDAVTNHWGQIGISEVAIVESAVAK